MLSIIISSLCAAASATPAMTFANVANGVTSALEGETPTARRQILSEAKAYAEFRQKTTPSFRETCARDARANRFCAFLADPETEPANEAASFEIRQTFVKAVLSLDDVRQRARACPAAVEELQTVLNDPGAKILYSRARYWSWVCAGLTNDRAAAEQWRDSLWTHHPLSALTLEVMRHDQDARLDDALAAPEREWPLKLRGDVEQTSYLRGIEALLELNEAGAAAVVLKRTQSLFADAPPTLRIYVGALAARTAALVPNTAPAFRALEPLVTTYREYMHRPVLEALYPRPAFFDELLAARGSVDAGLFAGLVHQESSMYPRARSSVAFGLTQMRPETADDVNARLHLAPAAKLEGRDLFDPRLSLGLGAEYLSWMLTKFNGDQYLALAAYHSGDERLRKWLAASPKIADPLVRAHVLYLNAPSPTSTAVYVINVLGRAAWYRALYGDDLTGN